MESLRKEPDISDAVNHGEAIFRKKARILLLVILCIAGWLRLYDLNFWTQFVDEGTNVLIGRALLYNPTEIQATNPVRWTYGWYVWPVLSAYADQVGGIPAVRALSGFFGLLTIVGLYGFTKTLFGIDVALSAAAIYSLLGPAIYVCIVATYNSICLCFLVFGMWLYAWAWKENQAVAWLGSALLLFLSFLSKYFVALYFPFLVILALRKGWKPLLLFSLPLFVSCAAFGLYEFGELTYLVTQGPSLYELVAPKETLFRIYVWDRLDFWILAVLSLFAWPREDDSFKWASPLLWLGAATMAVFQWHSRADFNAWKHAPYCFLFLCPTAAVGVHRIFSTLNRVPRRICAACATIVLAIGLGWSGQTFSREKFVFWPDVRPILAFLQNRLSSKTRMLADDLAFQYYLEGSLKPKRTIFSYLHFEYGGATGPRAFAQSVKDGLFEFVLLDGWAGPPSVAMRETVRPVLDAKYSVVLSLPSSKMGGRLEVFERTRPSRFFALAAYWQEHVDAKAWVLLENPDIRLHLEPHVSVQRVFSFGDFKYGDLAGLAATIQAVRERFFSSVVLGGGDGITDQAKRAELLSAVNANYELQGHFRDDSDGPIELYAVLPPKEGTLRLEIDAPRSGELVRATGIETILRGRLLNAAPGWWLRAEVFTNRWYPQGEAFTPAADGSFTHTIYLGGPCEHLVRVTLYDEKGSKRASASIYGVMRANPDGTAPKCP
ncbi:MAG TPA: glycosyltransferase family 39 protein [Candidatus Acidoferrales bacterium]|nr:glycosyltransferase family 39 protein [Candidatus Acidoferrales bacterium]